MGQTVTLKFPLIIREAVDGHFRQRDKVWPIGHQRGDLIWDELFPRLARPFHVQCNESHDLSLLDDQIGSIAWVTAPSLWIVERGYHALLADDYDD